MSEFIEHPYPEREYPPVSPEYRAALKLADKARKEYIAKLERERCETAENEGRAA